MPRTRSRPRSWSSPARPAQCACRQSVGSWLYGVALRVAVNARSSLARRRRHERHAGESRIAAEDRTGAVGISDEVAAILHEELGRLPDRYRAAVVLCYLEGQTCEAAAGRLGWPVGTVKSRLARGRHRLRNRLIRRGLAPEEATASPPSPAPVVPAALARTTIEAMVRFAAGRPIAGVASATVISWTVRRLRTMQWTRFLMSSIPLILGLAATGAMVWTARERRRDQPRPLVPAAEPAVEERRPARPAATGGDATTASVRVADWRGLGMPEVEVKVVEFAAPDIAGESGYRTSVYRTGGGGLVRIPRTSRFHERDIEARLDERMVGWTSLMPGQPWPNATDDDPITLALMDRSHHVEGTLVDTRGKPIRGVHVRLIRFGHVDGPATDQRLSFRGEPTLGSAVTDEAGRYRLSLRPGTTAVFTTSHFRFVGTLFSCKPEDRTIPPVTLEDAGWIAGSVVNASIGEPVVDAWIIAEGIEQIEHLFDGGHAMAPSDERGRFVVGGLSPAVYNLLLARSPKGRSFVAPAIEGVRVEAGEEARADLRIIAGRRLRGIAIHATTGKPLGRYTGIDCFNASDPRSGLQYSHASTDEQGRFEFFVPPGLAWVSIRGNGRDGLDVRRSLDIPVDRDPEPIVLKQEDDPERKRPAKPAPPVEFVVRIRVKTDAGDRRPSGNERTLTGRVFDQTGSPLVGVKVHHGDEPNNEAATDRLGVFRLKRLPIGTLRLGLRWEGGERRGRAIVPAEAVEVNLILPETGRAR